MMTDEGDPEVSVNALFYLLNADPDNTDLPWSVRCAYAPRVRCGTDEFAV